MTVSLRKNFVLINDKLMIKKHLGIDIKEYLKQRSHLNDIPLSVKKYLHLN